MEAIASRLKAIAVRLEAIVTRNKKKEKEEGSNFGGHRKDHKRKVRPPSFLSLICTIVVLVNLPRYMRGNIHTIRSSVTHWSLEMVLWRPTSSTLGIWETQLRLETLPVAHLIRTIRTYSEMSREQNIICLGLTMFETQLHWNCLLQGSLMQTESKAAKEACHTSALL